VLSGLVVWAFLSAVGIAALVAASATAFTVLKLAGAAYLIYLGLTTLLRTRRLEPVASTAREGTGKPSFGSLYRQGLLSNLLNPKVGVFGHRHGARRARPARRDRVEVSRAGLIRGRLR
jgi:threonine/homoserine/homoserine lactone efflux protein